MERIALISDVHGNLTALEAVLADIAGRGITRVWNLGDYVGKGPRGSAVVDRCAEVCEVNVRGNWDDRLPDPARWDPAFVDQNLWWHDELRSDQRAWLLGLPLFHDTVLSGRRLRLVHASTTSVHHRVHVAHTDAQFEAMFAATDLAGPGPRPHVVGYADIHATYLKVRAGGTLFNVGSVGNPLDEPVPSYASVEGSDAAAHPGGAGSGGPHAGAGADAGGAESGGADRGGGGAVFAIRFVRVPYDAEAEIAVARRCAMPDLDAYAGELRTARYRALAAPDR